MSAGYRNLQVQHKMKTNKDKKLTYKINKQPKLLHINTIL